MPAFDPAILDDARQRRFFRHWLDKRGAAALPSPGDFDPLDISWALGWLSILNVDGGTFRWRLDGSRLAEFFRVDMTGLTLEDYPDTGAIPEMRETLREAADGSAPAYARRRYVDTRGAWAYRTLVLPAGADRATTDTLFQILALDPE
ncbi:MAG: PAS domain-containing protein [Tagaea sp.]